MKRLGFAVVVFALLMVGGPALAAPSGIFTADFADGQRRVDPIVSPGGQSAHEHCFYGVRGITHTETSASLRLRPSTWVVQSNHSAFWIPCVYEDGRLMTPATSKHILAYYQPVSGTEQVPPENTAGVSTEMGYRCGTGGGTVTDLPPGSCPAGTPIVVSGFMRGDRDRGSNAKPYFKPAWYWRAGGFPRAQAVIALLWFGLGERRRDTARRVLREGRGVGQVASQRARRARERAQA